MKKYFLILSIIFLVFKVNSFAGANLSYYKLYWTQYSGNGDSIINPGEVIELKPAIRNTGTSGTDNVIAWLASTSTYVTFSYTPQGAVNAYRFYYNSIPAGTYKAVQGGCSQSNSCAYYYDDLGRVTFSASTPPGTIIPFTLYIKDGYGNSWTSTFTVTVTTGSVPSNTPSNANLIYDSLIWYQYSGNGDLVINPGETIDLRPAIKNIGTAWTSGVKAWLSSSSPYISFNYTPQNENNYYMYYGTVYSDGNKYFQDYNNSSYGRITISANTPTNYRIPMVLNIKDGYGNLWNENFTIMMGNNNPPIISWLGNSDYISSGVYPESGLKNITNFIFKIKYTDMDGDAPKNGYPKLHILKNNVEIEGSPFTMNYVTGDFNSGAIYEYNKIFSSTGTNYSYYFEARDTFDAPSSNYPFGGKQGPFVYKSIISWTGEENYVSDGLNPESGDRNTNFVFRIKYTDGDNEAPISGYPKLHILSNSAEIPGSPFTMNYLSGSYNTGAIYTYTITLLPYPNYTYYFEAKDSNGNNALGSPTNSISGPIVTNNAPVLGWTGETNYENDGVDPDSGNSDTNYVFKIKYIDADNDAPATGPKLHILSNSAEISGSPFTMNYLSGSYNTGAIYTYSSVLPFGVDSYYFEAKDIYGANATGEPTKNKTGAITMANPPAVNEIKVFHGVFKPNQSEKTYVSFTLPATKKITIKVYSTSGKEIKTLYNGIADTGLNTISWDGTDSSGSKVSSGVYLIKIEGSGIKQQKKVVVIK